MKKMKILFVGHETEVGGATVSLVTLIRGLKEIMPELDIRVAVPRGFHGKKNKEYLEKNGICCKEFLYRYNFKYIGEKKGAVMVIHDIWNFINVLPMLLYIKKEKFDRVCSNSTGVDVGARAALLAKVPHIYYVREFMEEDHGCEYRNKKRMRDLLESSDYVIFISKAIQKKYTQLYKLKNYTTFFNGFILNDYFIPDHIVLQNDKLNIIQIGTLSDGKGTLNSLMIIKKLRDMGVYNIHIEFVGTGNPEYVNVMKQYIKDNKLEQIVTISGYSKNIKEKVALSDILLMNSRAEGFGRVTIEGMLGGLLVIGRNSAGTAEIIQNEQNGLLFDNDGELVTILMKVSNNKEMYRLLARKGQQWAVANFNYKDVGMKFKNFIGL